MRFQRKDLAGAIRTKSFLVPVPVGSIPPTKNDIIMRILSVIVLAIFAAALISQTGCCSLLTRINVPDGEFYPATKLNYASLCFVRDDDPASATVFAIDFIPSIATDTLLLPVDLLVALKKEVYP